MINENVSDSAAATQQHLVLHRALVYIQRIAGGPVGEHTHTHTQSAEKAAGIRGFGGQFAAVSLISSPPATAADYFSERAGIRIHQLC